VLISNIQGQRFWMGVMKDPGRTWIQVNCEVHTFAADDQDFPQISEVNAELRRLSMQMNDDSVCAKYQICVTGSGGRRKDQESVEPQWEAGYSIMWAPGTPLHIFKNLWVFCDCHTATKFIAINLFGEQLQWKMVIVFISLRTVFVLVAILVMSVLCFLSSVWIMLFIL
jgi:hypothetical protein